MWSLPIGSEVQFATVDGLGNLILGAYGDPASLASDEVVPTQDYDRRFIAKLALEDGQVAWAHEIDDLMLAGNLQKNIGASPSGKVAFRRGASSGTGEIVEFTPEGTLLSSSGAAPTSWGWELEYDDQDRLWIDGSPGARLVGGQVETSLGLPPLLFPGLDVGDFVLRIGRGGAGGVNVGVIALELDGSTPRWEKFAPSAAECPSCIRTVAGRMLGDGAAAVRYQIVDSQGQDAVDSAFDLGCGASPIALAVLGPDGSCRWQVDLEFGPFSPLQMHASLGDVLLQRDGLRVLDGETGVERRRWPDVSDLQIVASNKRHPAVYVLRFNVVNGKNAIEVVRLR